MKTLNSEPENPILRIGQGKKTSSRILSQRRAHYQRNRERILKRNKDRKEKIKEYDLMVKGLLIVNPKIMRMRKQFYKASELKKILKG